MSIGPGSQSSLREANAARVIETVRKYGQLTQVELSAASGLSQASISNIVKRLVAEDVLEAESTIRSGRRAQMISLARRRGLICGTQISRRWAVIAIADLSLEIQEKIALPLPVNHRPDTTLDRVSMLTAELLERMGAAADSLLAVGVTMPAPIDPTTSMVSTDGVLPGWEDIDIAAVLTRRLQRPVIVDNDANGSLLAEARLGNLRGVENAMFLRSSYSTGAAIMVSGQLHRGTRGTAGEIGHVQIEPAGLICACGGRGCLNTVVGADVLVSSLRLTRGELSLSDVISEAINGDPGCRQVISDASDQIGSVLANSAILFEPHKIIIGGELAKTGEIFVAPIRDAVAARPMLGHSVTVELSALGEEAELYGALVLALEEAESLEATGTLEGSVAPLQERRSS